MTPTPDSDNPTPDAPTGRAKPRGRRQLWLTLALACVVFIAGAVTGGGIIAMRVAYRWHHHPSPQQITARITAHMQEQLGLTDTQAHRVRQILAAGQQRFAAIRQQIQPQVRAQMQRMHDQINAVLTPIQKAKWKKMYEQMSHHWHWRGHHWHHRPRHDHNHHHMTGPPPGTPRGPALMAPPARTQPNHS